MSTTSGVGTAGLRLSMNMGVWCIIDDQTNSLLLRHTFPPRQHVIDVSTFLNALAADTFPVDNGPQIRRKVPLAEDMVGDVGELLKFDLRVEFDSLGHNRRCRVVQVNIIEPNGWRHIFDDQLQRGIRTFADTLLQQVLHSKAPLDFTPV